MPRTKAFDEEEILQKAVHLFWSKGFHATSMQDVVDELGINRASIYDNYGNKRALFLKAFASYRQSSVSNLKAFLATQKSVKKGLKKLFLSIAEEAESDKEKKGCFVVNTTTELAAQDEEIKSIIQENQITFEDLFYDYLKLGVERGEISKDKDLKTLALFLFTLNNGMKVLNRTNTSKKELERMVDTALAVLD